jgi:hypothetical protein
METMGTILGSGLAADLVFRALRDRLVGVEGGGRPERQISKSISR